MRGRLERVAEVLVGWWEGHRLSRAWPDLVRSLEAGGNGWRHERAYRRYVDSVSTRDMALSAELARASEAVLRASSARRVLDLGSGFSSYLFRAYFREEALEGYVYSVDDDPTWLEETRNFLASRGLSTENLLTLDEMDRVVSLDFDVVFYDLGRMPTRQEWLPHVLDAFGGPDTCMLIDDLHKPAYRKRVRAECERRGLACFSLRSFTRDGFGRYAGLVLAGGDSR